LCTTRVRLLLKGDREGDFSCGSEDRRRRLSAAVVPTSAENEDRAALLRALERVSAGVAERLALRPHGRRSHQVRLPPGDGHHVERIARSRDGRLRSRSNSFSHRCRPACTFYEFLQCTSFPVITARCTIVQSAVLRRMLSVSPSVCPSVCGVGGS